MRPHHPAGVPFDELHEPLVAGGGLAHDRERVLGGEPLGDGFGLAAGEPPAFEDWLGLVYDANHASLLVEVDADELLHGWLLVWKVDADELLHGWFLELLVLVPMLLVSFCTIRNVHLLVLDSFFHLSIHDISSLELILNKAWSIRNIRNRYFLLLSLVATLSVRTILFLIFAGDGSNFDLLHSYHSHLLSLASLVLALAQFVCCCLTLAACRTQLVVY